MVLMVFYSQTQREAPKMLMINFRGNRSGLYEFFRGKAWVCGHALVGMAKVSKHYPFFLSWVISNFYPRSISDCTYLLR